MLQEVVRQVKGHEVRWSFDKQDMGWLVSLSVVSGLSGHTERRDLAVVSDAVKQALATRIQRGS